MKLTHIISFLSFLLWINPFITTGQRYISGRITDAENKEPLPNASVFIANTTAGTTTDADGRYRLRIPGEGSYQLTVSYVGYQPVYREIEPGNTSVAFDAVMNIKELDEVTVTKTVKARQRDINFFWKTLLGKSPSKKTIYAVNPEAAYYYYNTNTRILTVTCREPLQIVNNETGYHIQLVQGHFTHNYNTNISSWEHQLFFRELEPKDDRQKMIRDENRKKAYRVSLSHFIKSLYHNTLMEDGFLLTYTRKKDASGNSLADVYENPQIFLTGDSSDECKSFYIPSESNDLMLVCFGKPIDEDILIEVDRVQKGWKNWSGIGLHRNILQTPGKPVYLFPDGTYKNDIQLLPFLSQKSLFGLNTILPLEYIPDEELSLFAEPDVLDETELTRRFEQQLAVFPQEKIYMHTDKPYYVSGERIWFRAHLTDAASHVPVAVSRYVYVELINPLDSIVARVKIREVDGAYYGYLLIPEEIPEGDYTMRAYTTFMRSQDEHYFFTKPIRIVDPQARMIHTETDFTFPSDGKVYVTFRFSDVASSTPIVPASVKAGVNDGKPVNVTVNEDGIAGVRFDLPATVLLLETKAAGNPYRQFIRIPAPDNDFDVSFYPEGGHLMQGTFCNIAFKAMKSNGQACSLSGMIYDQSDSVVERFKTDYLGMGNFMLLAEKGNAYYAVCQNDKGQTKRFDLPAAVERGYALSVGLTKNLIGVTILQPAETVQKDTLYLLAHTRGEVHFAGLWDQEINPDVLPIEMDGENMAVIPMEQLSLGGKNMAIFQMEQFPSGVLHFILFDVNLNPLSERLVFINNPDQVDVTYRPDKDSYDRRSLVNNQVIVTDIDGAPLTGSFSVSVTSDREVIPDSTSNILTQLLLTSDLHGHIENPAYYFQPGNARTLWALDLLMRTQGWRRYNIEELAQGRFALPVWHIEAGAEVSGIVKNLMSNKPADDIEVTVTSLQGDYFDVAKTDMEGRFHLYGGEFPDSAMLIVSADSKRGITRLEVIVNEESFPEITLPSAVPSLINKSRFAIYAGKTEQIYAIEHGIRTINLEEVTVLAVRQPQKTSLRYDSQNKISITSEQLEKIRSTDMRIVLSRIPGLKITGSPGGGYAGTYRDGPVTLVVNDVAYSIGDYLHLISKDEIDQIDFVNGFIILYTTNFKNDKREIPAFNIKTIKPLGYQQPVEFYAPKYDTPASKASPNPDLRTTIHWQPVVTIDEEGVATFEFYTADEPGSYTVIIEGLTNDGRIIRKEDKVW